VPPLDRSHTRFHGIEIRLPDRGTIGEDPECIAVRLLIEPLRQRIQFGLGDRYAQRVRSRVVIELPVMEGSMIEASVPNPTLRTPPSTGFVVFDAAFAAVPIIAKRENARAMPRLPRFPPFTLEYLSLISRP